VTSRVPTGRPPIVLYVVTEDWYFLSHRLPMAMAAQQAGYQIHVATNVNKDGASIEACGFRLTPLSWRRGSVNPLNVFRTAAQLRALYRRLSPDLVHHVALQPAIIGTLAARGLPVVQLNALAGLGSAFTSNSIKARVMRPILRRFLRWLLGSRQVAVLVQNLDDRREMESVGVAGDRIFLIPGSGVDVVSLKLLPEPDGPVAMAFVGRLLEDKGLRTLIAAHDLLSQRGRPVRLLIAGEPDPANPASIPQSEIEQWARKANVEVLGHVDDIGRLWARAHIAVLPSRREGLPKSLLEAAACGRPIVASDVPGCREIAREGVNALLVPADDATALAEAIDRLASDPALRQRFGQAGRQLVEERFSDERIGRATVELYNKLLRRPVASSAA
jgi:glycosyltransferase involved in cell wall biosynthesis